VFRKREKWE